MPNGPVCRHPPDANSRSGQGSPVASDARWTALPNTSRISDGLATQALMEELAMSLWDVIVSIFWFMILFAWIWMLIVIFGDIFRDHELSGWGKALWALFLIVLPWLGALVYLIARGRSMNERARAQAQRSEQEFARYVKDTAASSAGPSSADEIAKLAELRDRGTISTEEFERAKAKLLGGPAPASPLQRDERTAYTS
jgi:hypothetical protein